MDVSTLQTFLAAATSGSFAGAAQRVHASPSTVTERIKQLEYRLGTTLFDRDKRGCRLTSAGERLVGPATQAVRAWEIARHEVALPERFSRSIAFGGQYFLWDRFLLSWLDDVRNALPELAIRATAGGWTRINRALAERDLDMVVVHDPIFRRDIATERLFDDRLVLVSAGDPSNWRSDYVQVEWGQSMGERIAGGIGIAPENGLVLDLGKRAGDWLANCRMAGYLPLSIARPALETGAFTLIEDAPQHDFPGYVCWQRDFDPEMAERVFATLKDRVAAMD